MVVPARHLALVLVATHVRGDADHGLVDVAVAKATAPITWAVPNLVVGLYLEAFVTECWLARRGPLVQVMEGDVVFVGRALSSSDSWHTTATGRGTGGRLRVNVVKNASGEPRMYETATGLEQGVVVHPDVLFQGLEACAEHGAPGGVTGSRERVWERPLDRGKLGTGHYVLLLMRLDRACAMSGCLLFALLMRSFVLVVVLDCADSSAM